MPTDIFKQPFHCVVENGQKFVWSTKRLWELAADLPRFEFKISDFDGFDKDFWFGDQHEPTIQKVLEHCEKIQKADLSFPIIVSEHGLIMDGVHRICRAHIEGRKTLPAVQFDKNPEPDEVVTL